MPLRRTDISKPLASVCVLLVALTACGEEASDVTAAPTTAVGTTSPPETAAPVATTTQPSSTEAATTTVAAAGQLPDTSVTASLGVGDQNTYKFDIASFTAVPFEDSELPVAPGSVQIRWYVAGDMYAVAYVGLDLSATGPLCPGNSIRTLSGQFEDVSNAPTAEGACEGFPTLTSDPEVGPRECDGAVVYVTAIPSNKEGTLYGTLEALVDDGTAIIGLTSQASTRDDIAELDVAAVCGG